MLCGVCIACAMRRRHARPLLPCVLRPAAVEASWCGLPALARRHAQPASRSAGPHAARPRQQRGGTGSRGPGQRCRCVAGGVGAAASSLPLAAGAPCSSALPGSTPCPLVRPAPLQVIGMVLLDLAIVLTELVLSSFYPTPELAPHLGEVQSGTERGRRFSAGTVEALPPSPTPPSSSRTLRPAPALHRTVPHRSARPGGRAVEVVRRHPGAVCFGAGGKGRGLRPLLLCAQVRPAGGGNCGAGVWAPPAMQVQSAPPVCSPDCWPVVVQLPH